MSIKIRIQLLILVEYESAKKTEPTKAGHIWRDLDHFLRINFCFWIESILIKGQLFLFVFWFLCSNRQANFFPMLFIISILLVIFFVAVIAIFQIKCSFQLFSTHLMLMQCDCFWHGIFSNDHFRGLVFFCPSIMTNFPLINP